MGVSGGFMHGYAVEYEKKQRLKKLKTALRIVSSAVVLICLAVIASVFGDNVGWFITGGSWGASITYSVFKYKISRGDYD